MQEYDETLLKSQQTLVDLAAFMSFNQLARLQLVTQPTLHLSIRQWRHRVRQTFDSHLLATARARHLASEHLQLGEGAESEVGRDAVLFVGVDDDRDDVTREKMQQDADEKTTHVYVFTTKINLRNIQLLKDLIWIWSFPKWSLSV